MNEAERKPSVEGLALDPREEAIRQCVFALAGAARTLLECELSMHAHRDSSVAYNRRRAEDALSGMGVTWCPQRGWVQAVLPAGAVPLRDDRLASQSAPAQALPVVTIAEMREVMEALSNFRDAVLHNRGVLEEGTLNNDQTNAVLAQFDNDCGAAIAALRLRLDGEKT